MIRCFLESHDVWFFRTSRPFGAVQVASSGGEAHVLPPPNVVFGALRTQLGERHRVDWEDYAAFWKQAPPAISTSDWRDWHVRLGPPRLEKEPNETWPVNALTMRGCLPACIRHSSENTLFPAPEFVLLSKDHDRDPDGNIKSSDLLFAWPKENWANRNSAEGLALVLPAEDAPECEATSLWLTEANFRHVLLGESPKVFDGNPPFFEPNQVYEIEPRIGIARDIGSRTTLQGHLYNLEAHRWKSRVAFKSADATTFGVHALLDQVSLAECTSSFAVNLGGERRLAWCQIQQAQDWFTDTTTRQEIVAAIAEQGGWWMSLATPAWFQQGWRPRWAAEKSAHLWHAEWTLADGTLFDGGRLVGMVSGAPVLQSGWDLARVCPKPVSRLMPVGATWFFALPDANREQVLQKLNDIQGTCIAERDSHAGYGLAFVGAWKREKQS